MAEPIIPGFTTFLLPLTNDPQTFEINMAGVNYNMTVKWNDSPDGGWVFDLADAVTNDSIVAGVPMITGGNCLAGLDYLGINGELLVYTDGDDTAVPTYDNLGVESNLYFLTQVVENG
jgi:hypothetical protein